MPIQGTRAYRGEVSRLQTAALKRHHEFAGLEEPLTHEDDLVRREWLKTLVPEIALTRLTARPAGVDRWNQFRKANKQPLEDRNGASPMSSSGEKSKQFGTPGSTVGFGSPRARTMRDVAFAS